MEVTVKSIGYDLKKITTDAPREYREFMLKVLNDGFKEVKQSQPKFEPTLLVDGSPKKDPMKVRLDGTLTLLDDIPDISPIIKDAEAFFYQVSPAVSGEYKSKARWLIGGSLKNLPANTDENTDSAILVNISGYSRRMEFGKKETNVASLKVKRSRRKLKLIKTIKKRWAKDAPEGVLLKVASMLRAKYSKELKAKRMYIRFKKIKGISGEGGLDSYPGIMIGRIK
jgi:hypothetical protein